MSRLDRLVSLLDTGSTQLVRNTAADQLADVQKAHPDELYNLLGRVLPYLRSTKWDTRVAAARAIGGIADNTAKWDPNAELSGSESATPKKLKSEPIVKLEAVSDSMFVAPNTKVKRENSDSNIKEEDLGLEKKPILPPLHSTFASDQSSTAASSATTSPEDLLLTFDTLDIGIVLRNGKKLLGSGGREYDFNWAELDPAERLALQKRNVTARLGLGGEYMEDIVSASDFVVSTPRTPLSAGNGSTPTFKPPFSNQPDVKTPDDGGISSRARAMAKRKARADAKNQNKIRNIDLSASSTSRKLSETAQSAGIQSSAQQQGQDYFSITPQSQSDRVVIEHRAPINSSETIQNTNAAGQVWPFEGLTELLMIDLFDEAWQTRHGAAAGLREIIRVHGAGAGRILGKSKTENDVLNKSWLENLACRICCVFSLDRFGDYVSDQVIAPIRESVAQTLAALLVHLPSDVALKTFSVLYDLVMQTQFGLDFPVWEPCHGGMLGMRYFVAVRKDLLLDNSASAGLLDKVIECVLHGLDEQDDDVRAVSAATLIPIAQEFVSLRPKSVDKLITVVWECLAHLKDDLSASTGSVMDLLAKLCSFPKVLDQMRQNAIEDPNSSFEMLVPRLYPFLRHSITSVRKAVLRALLTFLNIDDKFDVRWVDEKALRLLFQNLLVEQNEDVLDLSLEVFKALASNLAYQSESKFSETFGPHVASLLALMMTPIGVNRNSFPMDTTLFLRPSGVMFSATVRNGSAQTTGSANGHSTIDGPLQKRRRRSEKTDTSEILSTHNIDSPVFLGDVELVGVEALMKMKIASAKALGFAMSIWPDDNIHIFESALKSYLGSTTKVPQFSTSRLVAAMILEEYGNGIALRTTSDGHANFKSQFTLTVSNILNDALAESANRPMYQDLVPYMKVVRMQTQSLFNVFVDVGHISSHKLPRLAVVVKGEPDAGPDAFSIADAEKVISTDIAKLKKSIQASYRFAIAEPLKNAQDSLSMSIQTAQEAIEMRNISILAAVAGANIALLGSSLPKKLNPVIRSLMDSVKEEINCDLQERSAGSIASLVQRCAESRKIGAADKMIKNLCAFLCVDTSEVPEFHQNEMLESVILSLQKEEDRRDHKDADRYARELAKARIKRRGARTALEILADRFGSNLFTKVPKLRDSMLSPLLALNEPLPDSITSPESTLGQELVDGLSVIRALIPRLNVNLLSVFTEYFTLINAALESKFSVLRYAAAKCFSTICSVMNVDGMVFLVQKVLPKINDALNLNFRQGAVECVYHLVHTMQTDILPYVVFLVVPILGRMSDSDNGIRLLATTTFAQLIKLVPLEANIPDPAGLPTSLLEGRDRERKFISQMLDPSKVENFVLPVAIRADLRKYQQEGVNWLAFLNKYHLHGILCDDMGLGKTLQSICIVASDHYLRAQQHAETASAETRPLPSLIVCPPTLTGHWEHELTQYAPFLNVVTYVGNPSSRSHIASQFVQADIVVTSYDICRNDVDVVSSQAWNYCVLDEGHIIKNAHSKLTKAVKLVNANHRLILSGTPIQNNVLELWSLFDFLMPGFLGTEKVFNERFAKPIGMSRNSKSTSKEQEAGALALEALHKQVLPFLLRRLKEEVLADLPPKIIQDYYCELSDLQKEMYEDFAKSQKSTVEGEMDSGKKENRQHVFQALQYMRKLCDHPALVLTNKHPQYGKLTKQLAREKKDIRDISFAPKITALRTLLLDCGINGERVDDGIAPGAEDVISQHRALIFFQLKEMLDIVENDLLKRLLPGVSYMRMDGSTDPRKRQEIVQTFNADPSIDVLLLTTHVGGLGLNLTGADTVIFVEHDWNPMKDLQAMDRAHRIGQKKVVNVYRLITRNTLEEKIMGLQRFKLNIANSIVNQQNAGLATMDTGQLLDLFEVDKGSGSAPMPVNSAKTAEEDLVDEQGHILKQGGQNATHGLGELWDEREYEEEYNLDAFIQTLS
ncbi:uncharacterized protein V1516DRAFT_706060 [Lipomyces oligophaga]|uniref:uncharacterized protein n=1 Tax=Lipomyces oligophaga TaxID=45792 RepID=UPI0034CE9CAB